MQSQVETERPRAARNTLGHGGISISRAKKLLRPLPRRATLHRWPIIKRFAAAARKSPGIWRFGEREIRVAIYMGSIIAFLPIFGAQFIIAFFVALALRANLIVIMTIQLVTNIVTAAPIYIFTAKLGSWLVSPWNLPSMHPGLEGAKHLIIGGFAAGLLFGFIADLLFRFLVFRRAKKAASHKQMRQT